MFINSESECSACFLCSKRSPIFNLLTQSELDYISKYRTEVNYKAGETIVKQGTPITHVLSFTSGLAKVFIEGIQKKNLILRFLKPTRFIGGHGLYVDKIHHFTVKTMVPSTVCFIEFEAFRELVRSNPDFAEGFLRFISQEGLFEYDRFLSLSQKQMHGRVADALIYLGKYIFEKEIHITRNDLADYTNTSPDSVIRVLKDLTNENIIKLDGKFISITDYQRLEKISNSG